MHEYTKYFKEQKGFDRFINKLYEKYKSLSKISGSIKLNNISIEEAISLSRLFGNTYHEKENITIQIKKFINIMNNSKYSDFDIEILVREYLGISLITNKEQHDINMEEEFMFYQEIIGSDNYLGNKWLSCVVNEKIMPYKIIRQKYHKNKENLKKELLNIVKLINNLPKEKILLPIYASMYTNDPHYLDLDTNSSNFFFYALSYVDNTIYPKTRREKIRLLSKYNIEIDSISNFVITYNLLSDKEYINYFSKNKESLILNIQNIISTEKFDTKTKNVFIFENPSMLTEVLSRNIDASIIISGGFPNSSVYLLIDKLLESNNKLYYNGDFDPEGLIIAQKLKDEYKDKLNLICYEKCDYEGSELRKKISTTRINKLNKITDNDLLIIKELLIKNKYAVYQENNKERILNVIENGIR